jgi:hypothetical protein
MRVTYSYSDSSGEYQVTAEVNPLNHNRIQVVTIRDDNGIELSMDEFDPEEQKSILWLAKEEAEELDRSEDPSDDDDDLEENESW